MHGGDANAHGALGPEDAATAALRESEQRYAAIFERAPFAIALAKLPERILVSVNDAFLRLFEFGREEILGRTTVALGITPGESQALVAEALSRDGFVRDMEVRRTTRSGATRVLMINIDLTPIGARPYSLTTIQDITARKDAEERLRAALQARDDFISIASHELKTPLTSLRLQLEILARDAVRAQASALTDRASRVASISLRQVDRLNQLVNNMLDISRLSAGRLPIQREDTDLGVLVSSVVERMGDSLGAAGCDVRLEAEPGVVASVDASRIDQVVTNLLTNVVKYAPGKPCAVRVARRGESAMIEVEDQGIGVPAGLEQRIFERFFRAIPHTEVSGFGLGLYIADQIVRAHGGRIDVASEEGKGSRFTVTLPSPGVEKAASRK
jgi:PAS domain S-box-containing protein